MQKRKIKNSERYLTMFGIFLILFGISIITLRIYNNYQTRNIEEESINNFFDEIKQDVSIDSNAEVIEVKENKSSSTIDYIAILEIPKINLHRGLVDKNSKNNNENKNIKILKESDMPNVVNGNLILASHSGNSNVSFFNKLKYLKLEDEINVYHENFIYTYKVNNIYEIDKTGKTTLKVNKDETTITLITCISNTNKQLVVVGVLESRIDL